MKTKKIIELVAFIIVVITACCFSKVTHDNQLKQKREATIDSINAEIDSQLTAFDKETDRTKKLEILKTLETEYVSYKKGETYKNCTKKYNTTITNMKKYFKDDYDNTIEEITKVIGTDVETYSDKEKLNTSIQSLKKFKDTLKSEYENYQTVTRKQYETYNDSILKMSDTYTARMKSIEEEEKKIAEEKEEEEAKKKAEAQANTNNNNVSSSDGSSNYSSGSDYNYTDGNNYSYDNGYSYNDDGNNYSSGNTYSNSESSSGNDYIYSGWIDNGYGKNYFYQDQYGNSYDQDGNYQGNVSDWMDSAPY